MGIDSTPSAEELKVTLTYTRENWATKQEVPVSLEFSGANMREVANKIMAHVTGLEMSDQTTEIAKDTKVITPDGEKTFDEFMAEASEQIVV